MAVTAVSVTACLPPTSVYGPPPDATAPSEQDTTAFETFREETESTTLSEDIETQIESIIESTYDPENEINEDVYGPPEWFDNGN